MFVHSLFQDPDPAHKGPRGFRYLWVFGCPAPGDELIHYEYGIHAWLLRQTVLKFTQILLTQGDVDTNGLVEAARVDGLNAV